jgi:hypothetical protein
VSHRLLRGVSYSLSVESGDGCPAKYFFLCIPHMRFFYFWLR